MAEEKPTTTRRKILQAGTATAATVSTTGCLREIGSHIGLDNGGVKHDNHNTPFPDDDPGPEPDPKLILQVAKNPEVNLKPEMDHVNKMGEVTTVLQGQVSTGLDQGFDQVNLILNGDERNPVTVKPETVENGFILPPTHLKEGKNTVQLQAQYNGETYTSKPVQQKTSFPKGHRVDINVTDETKLGTGLKDATEYSTPFKYDTINIKKPLQDPPQPRAKRIGINNDKWIQSYAKDAIDPETKRQVEQAETLEEVLDIAYKPLLQHVADEINDGKLRGISTEQLEVPVAIEYITEEFAGIDSHFWGYTNDPIEAGGNHGLVSGINLENGERWELELGPAGQNGLYGKPSQWGYNPEAQNNWLSQAHWHSLLRDHNEPKDQKATMDEEDTLQDAYEGGKIMNTHALFGIGFQFGGHGNAKYFPDNFLIPRRDTIQQDHIDPDTFKRIRNEIALTGYINDQTSNNRDASGSHQGAWEVTGTMPIEDDQGRIAVYKSSPGYEKDFHETMMDTVFDRQTTVTFQDVDQILG